MRNLKKVLAVVLTVALLAAMMTVPALAAVSYEDEALKLQTIGLFAGEPADLKLEEGVTRVQGLAFAIRAAGKEDEALALSDADVATELAKFTDAATVPAWAKKYTAYAIKNGITVGVGNNKLAPLGNISGTSFLVFVLKSGMGYSSVTTANVVDKAIEAKVITAAQAVAFGGKAALIRDDAAGILYGAAKNGINADGKTFIQSLIDAGAVDPEDAADAGFIEAEPDTLSVKSVESANLIQLKVEFSNTNYDEDEVKKESNYDFEGIYDDDEEDFDIIDVDLDGTTAILTLGDSDTDTVKPVDNQTDGTLTIDKAITGKEEVFEEIEFDDFDLPSIEDVQVIGEDTVKVIFSEPMRNLPDMDDEFDFELDGKSYSVDEVEPVDNGLEANVSVYGKFTEGTLTVEVGNGLEDYAGFSVKAETFELDVVPDDEPPVATGYKDADTNEVTLVFDEDIRFTSSSPDEDDFYHTNEKNPVEAIDEDDIDGNELTLKFDEDHNLPEGTAYVYVKSGALEDFWNNENDFVKVKVEIEEDDVAPTVEEIEMDADAKTVKITFSENLDEDSAEDEDNYVLVDEDDDEVSISRADYADDDDEGIVTLNLRSTPDDGIYEITISDVEDRAGNKIDEYSEEIELSDSSAPTSTDTAVYVDDIDDADTKEWKIYVQYDEAMAIDGQYSIDDLNKYEIEIGSTTYNLGEEDEDDDSDIDVTIDVSDGNKLVEISIDGLVYDDDMILHIARVADEEGNYSKIELGQFALTSRVGADGILIEEAVATAKDKIEVTFDGNLDDYDVDDFTVYNGTAIAANKLDIDDIDVVDGDEIIIWMDDDLPTDTSDVIIVTAPDADIDTENSFGIPLEGDITFSDVEDEIAPEVIADDEDVVDVDENFDPATYAIANNDDDDVQRVYATKGTTTSTIYIEFSETIDTVSKNLITVTAGSDELNIIGTPALASKNGLTNNVLVITVAGEVIKGDDIDITLVSDPEGNAIKDLALDIEYFVDSTAY